MNMTYSIIEEIEKEIFGGLEGKLYLCGLNWKLKVR